MFYIKAVFPQLMMLESTVKQIVNYRYTVCKYIPILWYATNAYRMFTTSLSYFMMCYTCAQNVLSNNIILWCAACAHSMLITHMLSSSVYLGYADNTYICYQVV